MSWKSELAFRVRTLLTQPTYMTDTRCRVLHYLRERDAGNIVIPIADRFPCDEDNDYDFSDISIQVVNGEFDPLSIFENAVLLAALHDAYCPDFEQVLARNTYPNLPMTDLLRSISWSAIISTIESLGDHSRNWFEANFQVFVHNLTEPIPPPPSESAPHSPNPANSTDIYTELRQFATELPRLQRAVVEAMIENGGRIPLADLAIRREINWETNRIDDRQSSAWSELCNRFNSCRKLLNKKLAPMVWQIRRNENNAILERT